MGILPDTSYFCVKPELFRKLQKYLGVGCHRHTLYGFLLESCHNNRFRYRIFRTNVVQTDQGGEAGI